MADDLFCSFCGKDRAVVRNLIQGGGDQGPRKELPIVRICDECIELCSAIIKGEIPKDG